MEEWITAKEASELLGISRRQVINRIHAGKLKAMKDNTKWLIHRSLSEPDEEFPMELPATSGKFQEDVNYLREQIEQKDQQIAEKDIQIERIQEQLGELHKELTEARKASDEASQRSDTIILQLTRQLEQSQRLLEYHQEPWYRKLLRRKHQNDIS